MLDIKLIRDNPESVKNKLRLRKEEVSVIDKILDTDGQRLILISKSETLKELRNSVSDEIAVMKKNKHDASDKIAEMKKVSDEIKAYDEELRKVDADLDMQLRYVPNLPDDSVPLGNSEKDNAEILKWGEKNSFDFDVKDHIELGKALDILDFERGTKISGSGFPLYKGKGAKLERALINFMLDEQSKNGYKEVMTPVLVNRASMEAAEKIPKFEEDMYHIEKDDLFAIPTAEVPILNIHRDEILKQDDLPLKYCGFTNCFRREAGSFGADVRGLNRVHQFDKVEIVQLVHPDKSYAVLEEMVSHVEKLLNSLELPYRILRLCGGDMGFASALTYDFEVYSAAQQKWLEVSSVSNFETFQTNRMKIRFKDADNKTQLLHSLNGSSLALPRIVACLLENNQADKTINLPAVLHKYFGKASIN